jgi:monoamine oxidase
MHSKKHGRTNIFASLQKMITAAFLVKERTCSVQEFLDAEKNNALSRRKFLEQAGKAATVAGLAGYAVLNESFTTANKKAEIIIVGAGIAGLSAAYHLQKHGFAPKIYEAADRTGGRIYTARNVFFEGSWTELGAEFIDTSHRQMWNYVREFNLETVDIFSESEKQLIPLAYYFQGRHYTETEIIEAFIPLVSRIKKDQKRLSKRVFYTNFTPDDAQLDALSLAEYLQQIDASPLIKNVIEVAYITEYGEEIGNQSALNFLTVIGTETQHFKYYGDSDERYKIRGGNDKIPEALTQRLQNRIESGHFLTAIKQDASAKKLLLHFTKTGGAVTTISADRVILTVPFTILRDVDISFLPEKKLHCIKNIGYGKNVKLFAGFNKKPWRQQNYAGAVFTDAGFQSGWDNSQLQENEKAGFTIFTGGTLSDEIGQHDASFHVQKFLSKVDKIFPGTMQHYNTITHRMHWPTYKFAKASYLSLKPGQYVTMSGLISEPFAHVYFAGEHCSYDFQGFMNGAATTGIQAAKQVMRSL